VTTLCSLLSPGYEPGDGTMDGAQLVDGQWWHPLFGCDSLQYVVDNARQALGPEVAIPAEQYQFNPKQSTTPMTFDPISVKPPVELMAKRMNNPQAHHYVDYTFFARWGAAQAVEALRHQWPEPITDRPPTEEDGDDLGHVLFPGTHNWTSCSWAAVADRQHIWLHTPRWRPKPEPTLKQQALEIVNCVFPCTTEQAETLLAALALIPDATP
jgi:hypothetical protein